MATILYLGDSNPGTTSAQRAASLQRLGHTVIVQDPFAALAKLLRSRWGSIHYYTGYRLVQRAALQWLTGVLKATPPPDVIWVDSGELLGPTCVQTLKKLKVPTVLFNVDDPTGKRDGRRFDMVVKSLPYYDLVVVVRRETEADCLVLGAKKVLCLARSYDEVAHRPFATRADIPVAYRSEVAFIGTWMRHEKRDEFLLSLMQQGIPISIWGSRWSKSPHWSSLRQVHRGDALSGRDYVAAIQGAKICLGLLSKGNRDLHTQRSLEVPFAGGLLCAERTSEHQAMYQEGIEAVFWADAAECARQCQALLQDDALREQIRAAGQQRVLTLQTGNEDVCRKVLAALATN